MCGVQSFQSVFVSLKSVTSAKDGSIPGPDGGRTMTMTMTTAATTGPIQIILRSFSAHPLVLYDRHLPAATATAAFDFAISFVTFSLAVGHRHRHVLFTI